MDWTVLTLGRFSRNRYWGEDESVAHRSAICTSTLIRAPGVNIIVDPALAGDEMAAALDGATGLKPRDIGAVYLTHAHGDHFTGLAVFPEARWLCPKGEAESVRKQLGPECAARVGDAPEEIAPGVRLITLPGHTHNLAGLLFGSRDGVVAVVGDAVMTRDFFDDRRGYFNSVDQTQSAASMEKLAAAADIIVPGHGNYFIVKRG